MISRRSLFFGLVAFFSLILLLASSRRLGSWPGDGADYTVYPPSPEPPTTGTHQQGDGSSKSGGSANGGGSSGTGDAGKTMPYHDGMPKRPYDPQCDTFPDTSGILLIMKTGASEAYDRIPTQLMTMLKCLPDFLIFSDMAQTIGGFQIRDSLETMLPEAMEGNKDFDLYRRQRACLVDQQNCNKLGDPATEGWNLDKYKNIHMAEKTYNLRPNYKWYVFVDADTYVLWPNLVQWLAKLDPNKKTYLGSVSLINNFPFSHGGSGYIVSHAALKEFAGEHPGIANKYDMRVHNECCGDYLFSVAMKDTIQLGVQQVWPTINGEKPFTLPYGPTHWCHPIVTMHHMNSEEVNSFYDFEHSRYAKEDPKHQSVLRIKDIYEHFVASKLVETRDDWDNLSEDTYYLNRSDGRHEEWEINRAKPADQLNEAEKLAHLDLEHCRLACESVSECFQYRWKDGICGTARAFMLGRPRRRDGNEEHKRWKSGWLVDKIHRWIEEQGECKGVEWPAT